MTNIVVHVRGLIIIIIIIFTAIGLSPGGSGYFTCKQNIKVVTTKFKSGGLHEKHVVAIWNFGNYVSICFWAQGSQGKPVSRWPVAGPSEYWLLASSPASKVKKKQCPHSATYTHKITTHTRQLQQYTRSANNNCTKDSLKLATKHTRQIRILQHVQKVKTPKQESTVYSFL